ncbi:restriction endonuclease subunit S [Lacrimispora sp. 38-1]|uniref:restriction endonuclease subunit S n=1 Tax=Lacrimispora sp. 38-1 TaxID=3125778 RepID=UPI003CF2AB76
MSEWSNVILKNIAEFNPRESIKKGEIAIKIGMDKLQPFCRDIPEIEHKVFSGGTKFRNGDTIMARITPCLENGKTAMVNVLNDDEVGFGSTEYIVLRAKKGITNPHFLYYLVCSSTVRELAIKSMVGSSGRQRVQTDVIENMELLVPCLKKQRIIGDFLKKIDDKITVNNKINRNLADQVSAIYKSWFVDFELYDGVCPDTWKTATLGDLAEVSSGKRPPMKQTDKTDDVAIPLVGAASIMGYTNDVLYDSKILVTGRVGTHGVIQRFNEKCWPSDNTLVITTARYEFVYQTLQEIDYASMNRGSTQPLITQGDLKKTEIIIPTVDVLDKFEVLTGGLMEEYEKNRVENIKLAELRDTLLPKLMSGELDVSEIDFRW